MSDDSLSPDQFLVYVARYIKDHPMVAPRVTDFVSQGLSDALRENLERAADMEAIIFAAITPGAPKAWRRDILIDKLSKWKGKTHINWQAYVDALKMGDEK